jgi:CubicO group peptidase (beta-lactamase class C family)
LTEPTAGAQPWRRELVFMPPLPSLPSANPGVHVIDDRDIRKVCHISRHERPGVKGMRLIASAAVCVMALTTLGRAEAPAGCSAPAAMSDDWPVSPPAQQGLDPKLICSTGQGLAKLTEAAPHGVVVIRHGVLVYEQYFSGADMRGYTPLGVVSHNANTLHNIGSITKGAVALLVGITVDRGWLKDLDVPIFEFFPEYADLRTPGKDGISLHHLLSMTSGLDWPERAVSINNPANVVWQGRSASDPYRFVLERSVEATPGGVWNYNSGGVWLLGLILRKVSGQPLEQFAKEGLSEPLGIKDWECDRFPNGDPSASGGLRLRPRDLAKLGQLVLDGGAWHGRQIVSAGWIKQMTAQQSPRGWWFGFARSYGYLWWQGQSSIGADDVAWVAALGLGGQRLYVVPNLNLVVAVTAGLYGASNGGSPAAESLAGDTALNSFALPAALGH